MELYTIQSCMFLMSIIFPLIQLHKYVEAAGYDDCPRDFTCGNITLGYPFYDVNHDHPEYCGYPGFEVKCGDDEYSSPEIQLKAAPSDPETYYLLKMDSDTHTVTVVREDLIKSSFCPKNEYNTNFNHTLYDYSTSVQNVTLYYDCPSARSPIQFVPFPCPDNSPYFIPNTSIDYNTINPFIAQCRSNIVVQVNNLSDADLRTAASLSKAFQKGFDLQWYANSSLCDDCRRSGGECGYNKSQSSFTCYCIDGADDFTCDESGNGLNSGKMDLSKSKIALLGSFSALGVGALVVLVYYVRLRCFSKEEGVWQKGKQDAEAFLRDYGTIGLQRYSYSDLKNLTNSFKDKLGQGGYGVVYKGKIKSNNHLIAVKILKKAEKTANDFINEVASIGKTNHVNVVTLLGFCYEDRHQALIYDFMPNGSLEKYLYGKNNNHSLSWEELFQIAIGIAKGLEYLHRGCNTRILHFDIKPHNILLDENLCPKISDFGLAKQCLQKESLVSLSEARGTMGYIAPEVFMRNYGGVSLKSDVYSYGMLVLDMVGCRRQTYNGDDECSNTEQYFPHYIYKQLEVGEALDADDILSSEENEIKKKMILVSLCCVKIIPSSRPEMSQVVDMLEGSVESLQIPPVSSVAPSSMFDGFTSLQAQSLFRSFSVTPTL